MELTLLTVTALLLTGLWAGAVNSVAGGGTFFSFPILLLFGMPPLLANTTNKFALWFASMAGVTGFWAEVKSLRGQLGFYFTAGLIGSFFGSVLLLLTPPERFEAMIPWLLLVATLIFAFGKRVIAFLRRGASAEHIGKPSAALGQAAIGIYGGFFAAGMGMLMMALYELSGIKSVHQMNGLKTFVGLGINGISALTFMVVGAVDWSVALVLLIGALIGGYGGAVLSKTVPDPLLRKIIIAYGALMTAYFFWKY
ncbi:MAG: sulfite exporter TauE/SafE family protein [Alphaproteobacteria bacterium]